MRISDWSSDVCSSDLDGGALRTARRGGDACMAQRGDRTSDMTATLDLWPIGNCQVSALIDRAGRFVWGCVPRVDGDPLFSSLLDDNPPGGEGATGFWEIDLEGCVETTQYYLRNTPILVTRHADASG